MTVTSDALYLTYEKECVLIDPATGDEIGKITLPEATDSFGRIRIKDDLLIASVFKTDEHYGPVPKKLIAMNRHSGEVVWSQKTDLSFPFVAISGDRVFASEDLLEDLYNNRQRKGKVPNAYNARILRAFDLKTGEPTWSQMTDRVVTWLAYSEEQDVLVASNKLGIEGWSGKSGEKLWIREAEGRGFAGHPENLWDKVVLWQDRVIDQRGPGQSYSLSTGEPVTRTHPLTGEPVDWQFVKHGHHCGYAVACEHLLTFRAGSAGFLDMETGGTTHLEGFRSGCRNSLIPANGVLCPPRTSRTSAFAAIRYLRRWRWYTFPTWKSGRTRRSRRPPVASAESESTSGRPGIWLKRSWGGEVKNVAVLVAIGVDAEGYRQVLGVMEGVKEGKESWRGFLRHLKERGLTGVELVTSDKCLGLVEVLPEFHPAAAWQRCMVHWYRNVGSHVPKTRIKEVMAMLKAIHAQEDRAAAEKKAVDVVARLREMKLAKAAQCVEEGVSETLSYMAFPREHWTRIRTNNPLERIMREIRRRTRVVGAFPDGNSALMLVPARLRHIAGTKWGTRKYLDMSRLTEQQREANPEPVV